MQNQISQLINKFKDKGYEVDRTIANNDKEDLVAAYSLEYYCENVTDEIYYDLLIFQNGTCRFDNVIIDDEFYVFSWKVSIQDLLIMSWSDIFANLLKHEIIQLVAILEDYYELWDFEFDDITDEYEMEDLVAAYDIVMYYNCSEKGEYELRHELLFFRNRTCRLRGIDRDDYWLGYIECFISNPADVGTLFLRYG